jgi:predicted permease
MRIEHWVYTIPLRIRSLFRRGRVEQELDEELRDHIERQTAQYIAAGMMPADARTAALTAFGGVERRKEESRDTRGIGLIEHLAQDLNYAVRGLRRSPGFTATVVATLALGVGANAAIFSLVDRMFLRLPAGIPHVAEVRTLTLKVFKPRLGKSLYYALGFEHEEFEAIRSAVANTASVAGYSYAYSGSEDPLTRIRTVRATPEFLPLVVVRPALGRFFTADEDHASARVAVLTDEYWRRSFGADSAVLGRSIDIQKQRYTVIGVAPVGFSAIGPLFGTDVWLPLGEKTSMALVARLHPGADVRQLQALATLAYRHAQAPSSDPDSLRVVVPAVPIIGRWPGELPPDESIVVRVAGVAAIILLITVTNVATLLLLRAARRRREVAVRLALGVSRGRLWAQLLTEGVLLAAMGAAAALLVGAWGGTALRVMIVPNEQWREPVLDGRVVAFALMAALTAGIVASVAPALRSTRADLAQSLREGAREGAFQRPRLWSVLVVSQTALSIVLVIGAGLFVRSLRNVHAIRLGYDVTQLVSANVWFYSDDSVPGDFHATMTAEAGRLLTVAGVEGVGISTMGPMGGFLFQKAFLPSGDTVGTARSGPAMNAVSSGFFATTGMRVLAGRDFRTSDDAGSERVMVVNESMAREVWPGQNGLGKCVMLVQASAPCTTVIGVVSDAHLAELLEYSPMHYYIPMAQAFAGVSPGVVVHTGEAVDVYLRALFRFATITVRAGPARRAGVAQLIRRDLQSRLPASAHIQVGDLEQVLAPIYRQWREGAVLFSMLGALALLVTMVGLYSVTAYMVARRTHEMGVRIALGAGGSDIVRLVVREGLGVVTVGIVVGASIALALGRLIESLLYGVSPRDPAVVAGASFVFALIAVGACLVPARRAMRVDPVEALRAE